MVRSETEREENMTKRGMVKEEDAGTTTTTFLTNESFLHSGTDAWKKDAFHDLTSWEYTWGGGLEYDWRGSLLIYIQI